MSSIYRKINYVEEGAYGSTVQRTLYAEFDATSDYVRIKDDTGNDILSYGEWGMGAELDLGQAIVQLLTTHSSSVESLSREEISKIFKIIKISI